MAGYPPVQPNRELTRLDEASPYNPQFIYRPPINKIPVIVYVGGTCATLILSIITLYTHNWVSYCDIEAGLTRYYLNNGDIVTYSDEEDACDYMSLGSFPECGSICSVSQKFENAGLFMLTLGLVGAAGTAMSAVWSMILLWKKFSWHGPIFFWILQSCGPAAWLAGMLTYCGYYSRISSVASSAEMGLGMYLAIVAAALFLALACFGIFLGNFFKKEYQ